MRVLRIDLDRNSTTMEDINIQGPVSLGVKINNELGTWSLDPFDPRVPFVIGMGPFVGGKMPGFHRLVATFKSPMTRTLHVAALGGAAYKFMGSGIDAMIIVGKAELPVVVFASNDGVEIRRINPVFKYGNYEGAYAFTKYLLDTYKDFFVKYNARAVVVGPAALTTYNGALVSIDVNPLRGEFRPGAEDFAARGGPGSVLARGHNVVGIVAGGRHGARYVKVTDMNFVNELTTEAFKKPFRQVMNEKTIKYRFDPSIGTGGTFGVNYPHYRELLPLFGYKSIYLSREERLRHVDAILKLFWKPFNDEVFVKSKSWYNCGDFGCSVVCKKVWHGKKVDYEPFHAMGPFIGNYIFEEAVPLVDLIDQYGLDAIEMGHVIAWIFDAIEHGLLQPNEVGLTDKPIFDPTKFDPEVDSRKNAGLARELIRGFVEGSTEILKIISESGIRVAARKLDDMFHDRVSMIGKSFKDLVVYVAYGSEGYMTPNLYWAPGMVAPMYVLGRYWTNYTPTFMEPEDFAKSSLDRAIMESLIDDSGLCRFHRGWAEPILEKLYVEVTGMAPNKDLYREMAEYSMKAGVQPMPWEGDRARDVVSTMAREMGSKEWTFEDYEQYLEWWRRFKATIDSGLNINQLSR